MPSARQSPGATSPTTQRFARAASLLAHPVLVMIIAAAVAGRDEEGHGATAATLAFTLGAALVVMGYSALQVRTGRWSHIDASLPRERSQLNRFASWVLLALAAGLAVVGASPGVVAALALSGLIVLSGQLLRGRLKSSLHVAFAAFATLIAWPDAWAVGALSVAVLVVGWSRLALGRHTLADVVAGALTGVLAGAAFHWFLRAGWPAG